MIMPVPSSRLSDATKLAPMVIPSGTLCSAMAQAMTMPATNRAIFESSRLRCSAKWSAWMSSSRSSCVLGCDFLATWGTSCRVRRSMARFSPYTTATPAMTAPAATSTAWLVNVSAASTDSVSRSKHTMESMMPPANDSSRLTVRFDSLLNSAPTMPPNPVPPAPATSVTTVMNTNGSMIPLYP